MVLRISLIIVIISIMNMIREDTVIDLDGPGPLPPFSVTCYKSGIGFTTAIRSEPISITMAMNVMMPVVTMIVVKA